MENEGIEKEMTGARQEEEEEEEEEISVCLAPLHRQKGVVLRDMFFR